MIEGPGIFLCFDDCHIDDWHEWLDFFDDHNMKATFYVSGFQTIKTTQWRKLREMQSKGHAIACHGFNHLRAGVLVENEGCLNYLNREIYISLDTFEKHGIMNVKHYAYPYGNRTEQSDQCLFKVFDTLRIGGCKIYDKQQILKSRLIGSGDYGKNETAKYSGHEGRLGEIIKRKSFVNFHMHTPIKHRLEYLANFGKHNGINFYSMKELDK